MKPHQPLRIALTAAILFITPFAGALTSLPAAAPRDDAGSIVPDSAEFDRILAPKSEMRPVIDRYREDLGSLTRFHTVRLSPARRQVLGAFYAGWLGALAGIDFDALSRDARIDYILLRNHLEHEARQVAIEEKYYGEALPLLPFAQAIVDLEENRRRLEPVDPAEAAALLTGLLEQIAAVRKQAEAGLDPNSAEGIRVKKTVANRAARWVDSLRETLDRWYRFSAGYDPVFTWWVSKPHEAIDARLREYAVFLRERLVGVKPDDETTIIGDPIGKDALLSELAYEMIPYSPEELIEIANREFAWCETEMKEAAAELGYEDWHDALEHVKTLHVEPGEQPAMVRDMAWEAIEYLRTNDLVTVPELASTSWRMEMLSPQQQMVSPFFLGGETIQVSYPTDTMTHEQKMMTMRGNNRHFSRAVVHHELIPGHHLQGFMNARNNPHREMFSTPFWIEGWALYWEMLLYQRGFAATPENRIGMMFWRMHRCARIIFSLSFHLEKMTPQECIDFLVERVGHERDNAAAEVRRSFTGDYGPLYQAAYMLGGLQIRAMRKELVEGGRMTDREFHDAILRENSIPIEILRAILTNQPLTRDFRSTWRFAQE